MKIALCLEVRAAMPAFSQTRSILSASRNASSTMTAPRAARLKASNCLRPEAIRLFTTRTALPPGSSRALGWDTPSPPSSSGKFFSPHSAGHLGYSGTSLWIDFERRLAIVLLTNRTWPHRQSQAIRAVRPAFHDAVMEALGKTLEEKRAK